MIEPSKVLTCLKKLDTEENIHKRYKRPLEIFYSNDSLKDVTTSLLYPSLSQANELNLAQGVKKKKPNKSDLRLDLGYVTNICEDTRFFITPSEPGLEYVSESLNLFESCLLSLPNFKPIDNDPGDTESYFNNLVESFFLYLDNENVKSEYNGNVEDFLEEDGNNLTNTEFKNEEDRPLMRQLFLSVVLGYSWCLKLFRYTEEAMEISKWNFSECEPEKILDTSLGLRESNRNYVFYNTVSQNLLSIFKSKDNTINSYVAEFMERLGFLSNIANTEMAYEPLSWNRIKVNFTVQENKDETPFKDEHEKNLNLIRNEMAKRLSGRSKCEYLRREVEIANSEMLQMESKHEEVLSKLEALKKQLNELPNTFKFESANIGKLTESKKLPKKLFDLLRHLNNFSQSNPLREINFKILKEQNYSFHMIIAAPKDLLFPSLEATKFLFPLTFHFYLEEDNLKTKQLNNTKISTRYSCLSNAKKNGLVKHNKPPMELVMNKFMGVDNEDYVDLGLDDFVDTLPETFHENMDKFYKLAQEFVWNLYALECYKTNNKLILSKILPRELQQTTVQSKYTYKEKNIWTLSNEAATVTVEISNKDDKIQFQFTNFEKTGKLEDVKESKLVEHLKENGQLDIGKLSGVSQVILDHFNSRNDLIHISVLFEAYSVIFDLLST